MREAGCTTIKMGLESADPEVLMAVGQNQDERAAKAYLEQVAAVLRSAGRWAWSAVYS